MPVSWNHYRHKEWGFVTQASQIEELPARVTRTLSDGVLEQDVGELGDYFVKGQDGYIRIVPASQFEPHFEAVPEPEPEPGVTQLTANTVTAAPDVRGVG